MKLLAVFLFAIAVCHAQAGNCYGTTCIPGDPGVECSLYIHDCYPDPDCDGAGCPGFKCADLYTCSVFGWPCGDVTCTYCTGCVLAGNCTPGAQKTFSALPAVLSAFLPDSLKSLHEKAWGLHGFRGSQTIACRRWKKVIYRSTHV